MKLITKNSDYAIRALVYLAKKKNEFVSSAEIAKKEGIPLMFLRRVLPELLKRKIIISKEGVKGGVFLRRPSQTITAAEVIKIFQGDIQLSQCMFRNAFCINRKTCVLRKKIISIGKMVERKFDKITIRDLTGKTKEKR
ncbi:MAG: Rrf2 family transcriptional regulator [Candidatus Omnitrophica bacterium]|nr:Rrf2 family transcriptional regulator [Candidatus Omnitrophota bacterium]